MFRRTIKFGRDQAKVTANSEMHLREQTGKISCAGLTTTPRKDADYRLTRTRMHCQERSTAREGDAH
jgi:hypothetical protein